MSPFLSWSNWNPSSDSCFYCRRLSYHWAFKWSEGVCLAPHYQFQIIFHDFSIQSSDSFEGYRQYSCTPCHCSLRNYQKNPRSLSRSWENVSTHCLLLHSPLILNILSVHTVDPPGALASDFLTSSPIRLPYNALRPIPPLSDPWPCYCQWLHPSTILFSNVFSYQ